jgi:hypothetical protein
MIRLSIPQVPPSQDNAYMPVIKHVPGRGPRAMIILSAAGRKFKTEMASHLAKTFPRELKVMKPNYPYAIFARYYMEQVENKTYPKTAKTRYKHFDTTNRIKLLEDTIADVSAVDDSHYLIATGWKTEGLPERTDIWIWNLEEEGCPFYAAALSL